MSASITQRFILTRAAGKVVAVRLEGSGDSTAPGVVQRSLAPVGDRAVTDQNASTQGDVVQRVPSEQLRVLRPAVDPGVDEHGHTDEDAGALFREGLRHHQQGQLMQARALYERVLAQVPAHFDALHLSGVAAGQRNDPGEAVRWIERAIGVNPDCAEAHQNLGLAFRKLNRLREALESHDRAISLRADYAEAWSSRGVSLQASGRREDALHSFARAVEIDPDLVDAWFNHGVVLMDLKRSDEAVPSFDQAIRVSPRHAQAHLSRGNALRAVKRWDEALASLDRAIEINPDHAQAHANRGDALRESNRLDESVASYDRAILIKPDFADACLSRGLALMELDRINEAVASYDRAILIKPAYAEAHSNRGVALMLLGRLVDARASYDEALRVNPQLPEARWNKSLTLLLTGDFERGWPLYEARWESEHFSAPRRDFPQPQWSGVEDIRGKTLLLHAEQGLGDTIQFCRYAAQVAARGARVILEAQPPLLPLLSGLAGPDQILAAGTPLPDFDYHCPLLSMPLACGSTLESIPDPTPYLFAPREAVSAWADRLGAARALRVGITWSGNAAYKGDRLRSMPFSEFATALPSGPLEYFVVQHPVPERDRGVLAARHDVRDFAADFAQTAALMTQLDLVVTTDTSIAHLAGALGKTTWVLLPCMPDWRWLLDRTDSPWYRTMKLYRQSADRSWASVLERVARDLLALASGKGSFPAPVLDPISLSGGSDQA